MKREKFKDLNEEILNEVHRIINKKGVEYQSDEDVLSNFKINAQELGLTKYQIWSVYFTKHVKSIVSKIRNNPKNPNENFQNEIEPIKSRIVDAIAYLLFLNSMINEDEEKN